LIGRQSRRIIRAHLNGRYLHLECPLLWITRPQLHDCIPTALLTYSFLVPRSANLFLNCPTSGYAIAR
jgi:hypothetical protein